MKNWFRKIGLILIMVLVTGLLTGCSAGSTVDTTLSVNEDLSGSRVMELVISQSVFDEYFTGTIEDLNAAITESCPADMKWVYDDSTGSKIYTFTIDFTSPEDYKAKVDNIIGEGSDVEIIISKSDSVWASGVMISENFSSGDVLAWLKTLCVEKGFVSSSNASKIFSVEENDVFFDGEEYSSSSDDISIDKIEYIEINSIDMLTDAKVYDCYDKTIVISIPEFSMEKKGEEIKAWLEERVPSGATGEWTTDGTDSVYTVSKEDMTAEQLETFLNEYFDSDACVVEQTDMTDGMSPFSFNIGLVETVDFTNYIVGDRSYYTDVNYYVKGENGYVGGKYLSDLAYYTDTDNVVSEYDGYRYGYEDYENGNLRTYNAYFQKVFRVKEVNAATNVELFGGLNRQITFILDEEPSDEEKAKIIAHINALGVAYDMQQAEENSTETEVEDTTEVEPTTEGEPVVDENATPQWKVEISEKMQEDDYTITIKQTGTREEIKASSKALFGREGDLYRVKDYAFFKPKYDVAVYDNFSFGDFVDYTVEDVEAKYVLNTGFGSEMDVTSDEENARADGSEVTIKDGVLGGVDIVCYGTQFNLWAVFFYLFIVIAIVCVVVAVLKSGILDGLKKNNAQPQAPVSPVETQPVVQPEAVQSEETQEEKPKFCGNCGAQYKAGATFCPQCGSKIEG